MADHLRKQIRAAAATALTGLTTTTSHVFKNRDRDLQAADLPALRIWTLEEATSVQSMGVGRVREHTLQLIVEACVKANSAYDDTVDLICKEFEIALDNHTTQTLSGLCKYIKPAGFELEVEGEGDKTIAVGRMTFEVIYFTAQGAPDVPL